MHKKNICIFLDGTWNENDDNTNVWRLRMMLSDKTAPDEQGRQFEQLAYYATGVGTGMTDKVMGGAFGYGLSERQMVTYQWLMEQYNATTDEGIHDDIYIFGFSRGAFQARSFCGLLYTVGLLARGAPLTVKQVYDRYRLSSSTAKEKKALQLEDLHKQFHAHEESGSVGGKYPKHWTIEDKWLFKYSRQVNIRFCGVWDTVSALGIDLGFHMPHVSRDAFTWHNARSTDFIQEAAHALAIDEHRSSFAPTLWNTFQKMEETELNMVCPDVYKFDTYIEQRWFVGAHSNVGGGYKNDTLCQIPFNWMMRKAAACGLQFRNEITVSEHNLFKGTIRDSFSEFLYGIGGFISKIPLIGPGRFYRPLLPKGEEVELDGEVGIDVPINLSIDKSVFERYQFDAKYRPPQLIKWAESHGIADLGKFKPCHVWVENAKEVIPKRIPDSRHQELVIP